MKKLILKFQSKRIEEDSFPESWEHKAFSTLCFNCSVETVKELKYRVHPEVSEESFQCDRCGYVTS